MTADQILAQNDKNINDALNFIDPQKIPVGIELITWPFGYAGVTYKQVMNKP